MLNGVKTNSELLKFRLSKGRLLFPTAAVSEYYHALGGFDLDDKGMLRLVTYDDAQGNKRLAFSLTRQPSGIQESIVASAKLDDTQTLRALFGEKEEFKKALAQLSKERRL